MPWCQSRSFLLLHRQVSTPSVAVHPPPPSPGTLHPLHLQNVNDGNGSFLPDEGSEPVNREWDPDRPSQGAWCCQHAGTLPILKSLTLTVKVNSKTRGGERALDLRIPVGASPMAQVASRIHLRHLRHLRQCRRRKTQGVDPGVGDIPWRRKWQLTPVLLPGRSHGQRNLAGYSL